MNFKYIKNISDSGEAEILLYKEIGDSYDEFGNVVSYGIDGAYFAHEMQYLQDKASLIKVRINSIGGTILDGYSIMSAILDSKVPVDTYIDGLAASIAGVIAMAGRKVYMKDYGTLMLHNPSGGSDNKVLDIMKATLVTIFDGRTGLDAAAVDKMMNKETWMNAEQALKAEMVDEVVSSSRKVKVKQTKNLSDLVLIYNKIINPKTETMDLINKTLGLDSAAAENEAVNSINELKNKNAEIEALLAEEKAKVEELTNAVELAETEKVEAEAEAKLEKVTEMVNTYGDKVKDKDATIKLALVDFDGVKNMLDAIGTGKAVKISKTINKGAGNAGAAINAERADWTLRTWEKKDEKGLNNIKNNSPEIYAEMYKEQYGVELKG